VGGADYTAMEELDGDAVRISFNGRYAARGKTSIEYFGLQNLERSS